MKTIVNAALGIIWAFASLIKLKLKQLIFEGETVYRDIARKRYFGVILCHFVV